MVKAYNYYAVINDVQWIRPRYKPERKIPKIPTTEAVNKIISRASKKYALIFKILMETGVMPYELSKVTLRDIDLEKRTKTTTNTTINYWIIEYSNTLGTYKRLHLL